MAFTSSNQRETTLYLNPPVDVTGPKLGPGTYNSKELKRIKGGGAASVPVDRGRGEFIKSQRAPFGISVDTTSDSYYMPTYCPAPGEYNLQTSLFRPKIFKDKNDQQNYLLVDNGHLHRKPQHYTASKVDRFERDVKTKMGPGVYPLTDIWRPNKDKEKVNEQKLQELKKKRAGIQKIKEKDRELQQRMGKIPPDKNKERVGFLKSTPRFRHQSISTHSNGRHSQSILGGNSKTTDGGISRIQENGKGGKKNLGPGYYRADSSIIKRATIGVPFSIIKSDRKIDWDAKKPMTSNKLGPGVYEDKLKNKLNMTVDLVIRPSEDQRSPSPTKKEDSVFVSNVPRFSTDDKSMKAKFERKLNEIKAKDRKKNKYDSIEASITQSMTTTDMAEEIEEVVKRSEPGPGQYYDPKLHTIFKKKEVPEIFQFFGSANERFKEQKPTDKEAIGPGTYDRFVAKDTKPSNMFSSKTKKVENYVAGSIGVPGPQDYRINRDNMKGASSKGGKEEQHFGTTIKRFRDDVVNEVPGPGTYIKIVNKRSKPHRQEHFGSLQRRNPLNLSTPSMNPPVAQYTPAAWNGTIGIAHQQKGGGAPANFTHSHRSFFMEHAPFGSSTVRWVNKVTLYVENFRGPGIYNKDAQPQYIKKKKQPDEQPNTFLSKCDRFEDNFKPVPGPGRYKELNQWKEQSQNVRYNPAKHSAPPLFISGQFY